MAGKKITELLAFLNPLRTDILSGVDLTTGLTKKFPLANLGEIFNLPEGTMQNGKIVPTVDGSGNLTVALKTLAGTDPSATDPVYVMIGGVVRTITSALSVTASAATAWFNLGSAELATKEVDLFFCLSYNATYGIIPIISRIPSALTLADFNATNTNEKGYQTGVIASVFLSSTDPVVNIGRFAATLSAGAGYTWSVPTFTASNLIQRPIYETRWLDWNPTCAAAGSMTYTVTTTYNAKYKIKMDTCFIAQGTTGTTGGSASNELTVTPPFTAADVSFDYGLYCRVTDSASMVGFCFIGASGLFRIRKYDNSNFGVTTSRQEYVQGFYQI